MSQWEWLEHKRLVKGRMSKEKAIMAQSDTV
jgi:hypothetical protein